MTQHYFTPEPDAAHEISSWQTRFAGLDLTFETDRQVFSRLALDYGTRYLLETILEQPPLYGRILDLGCGYGPVGIVLKRRYPHVEMIMSDVNHRAVALARRNLRLNHIQYVDVIQSDGLTSVSGRFDTIVLNPPIRAGKAVVYRLFAEAAAALTDTGRFYIVIQKKQGAPSAEKALMDLGLTVERLGRSAGYWVLCAGKNQHTAAEENQ